MMISTNGTQLYVQTHEQNGDPVIFLHFGTTGHVGIWSEVIPHFRPHYWAVAIDLRGHGRSEKPAGGYTISNMACDVVGVMDHLGIDRARFVGSSLGAEVSLRLAAEYPERVVSLVLEQAFQNAFGPHGIYEIPDEEIPAKLEELVARRAARPPVVADTLEEAVNVLLQRWGRADWPEGPFRAAMRGSMGPRPDGRYGLLTPDAGMEEYVRDWWLTRFEQDFARVRCSVLFLPDEQSMQDPKVQASMAWFGGLLPDSQVVQIPGAVHAAVWLDSPDECARAVLNFFGPKEDPYAAG
ncbi:MAG TPA: alpha/beta hydrolase [Symbiobacteriaceae bacterium]|nr:alpha/beta hydrolase [Symbiobacteriaceae bacterium]